jgi:hypothetical protein
MMQKPVRDLRQLVPAREHHREPTATNKPISICLARATTYSSDGIAIYVIDRDRKKFVQGAVRRFSDSIGPRME